MNLNVKKLLLAGAAVVAVSPFASQAYAADLTLTKNAIWADATDVGSGVDAADGTVPDNVDVDTFTLTITDDGAADDGNGAGTYIIGDITDTDTGAAGTGGVLVTSNAGGGDVDATATSIAVAGDVAVTGVDANDVDLIFAVTNDVSVGGALSVTSDGITQVNTAAMTIGGDLDVTGTTDITAAAFAGSTAALSVGGDATFTDLVTLTSGAGAGATATLTLSGDATFTADAVLDATAGDVAAIVFDGAAAQTVSGAIDGTTGTNENLTVSNAAGVTFEGDVGVGSSIDAILISNTGANSAATFEGSVDAASITLGDGAGTGTNRVTFNSAGGATTVDGTIDGTAGDIDTLAITGGANSVTFSGVIGGGDPLDSITVATASAGVFDADVSATAITLTGTGSFEKTSDGDTVTADINGATAGTGVLLINGDTFWVGQLGADTRLAEITMGAGDVLTVDAATLAADVTVDATEINLTDATSGITFAQGGQNVTVTSDIAPVVDGAGAIIVGDGAGEINFEGDVGTSEALSLASLTVTDGAGLNVVNAEGDLFVDAIVLNTDDTLNLLGTSGTVLGTIDAGASGAGNGTVVVGDGTAASEYTFSGAIGTTDVELFQVQAASTANISQNVDTTAGAAVAGVDIDGTLNISAADNTVQVTTTTGDTDIDGTVDITGDNNVTITGANLFIDGTFSTDLEAATLALNGVNTIGATSDTTLSIGNLVTSANNTTFGAAGRITTLNINKTAAFDPNGATLYAETGTITLGGDVLNIGVASTSVALADGDNITVLTSGGGDDLEAAVGTDDIVLVDTGFIDLELDAVTSTATNLTVDVALNDATDVVGANYDGAANALIDFAAAADELGDARNNLLAAPTAEAAKNIAESLSPVVDGGAVVGALNVSSRVVGLTGTRLAALRDGEASSGVAAGNMGQGMRGWGQAFGMTAEQDHRDGVDGYDADTYGLAVGADGEAVNGGHVGVALSYGNTEVDSDAGFGAQTDVDSYQISLYGDAPLSSAMYVEGMVGYAWNDVEATRYNVGGTGLNSNADYDADQFTAYAEVGRDYAQSGGLTLTPFALAHWTYYNADDYSETGAGAASLQDVDTDSLNIFELGVGVDAAWDIKNANGSSVKPVLSAGARYDLVGDEVDTTSSFVGGGAAFDTQGMEPGRATLNLGAGVGYYTTDNWELSAEYDYEYKSDYDGHSGQVRAAYHF